MRHDPRGDRPNHAFVHVVEHILGPYGIYPTEAELVHTWKMSMTPEDAASYIEKFRTHTEVHGAHRGVTEARTGVRRDFPGLRYGSSSKSVTADDILRGARRRR